MLRVCATNGRVATKTRGFRIGSAGSANAHRSDYANWEPTKKGLDIYQVLGAYLQYVAEVAQTAQFGALTKKSLDAAWTAKDLFVCNGGQRLYCFEVAP